MTTTQFIVLAALGFTACHRTRIEVIEKMCGNMSRCFLRYLDYSGCITGAQSADHGTEEEFDNMETAAGASCDELEILLRSKGFDTRWIK